MKFSEIKKYYVKFVKEFCKKYNLVKSQTVDQSLVNKRVFKYVKPTFGVKVYGTKENIMNMLNDCFYNVNVMDVDIKEEKNGLTSVILPYHFEESYS